MHKHELFSKSTVTGVSRLISRDLSVPHSVEFLETKCDNLTKNDTHPDVVAFLYYVDGVLVHYCHKAYYAAAEDTLGSLEEGRGGSGPARTSRAYGTPKARKR